MFLDCAHYYLEIQGLNRKKTGLKRNTFELMCTAGWFHESRGLNQKTRSAGDVDYVAS